MASYTSAAEGWTPINHADGASALADDSYQAVRTTSASSLKIVEVFIGGEATSSIVNRMTYRRYSTNASVPTDEAPAEANPLSAAATSQGYVAATTGPTIASTVHLMNLAFNAFGGVIRWVAAPGEEIWHTAGTAPDGEGGVDSIDGIGLVSTHIIFEEI